ncbi:hypothetical protein FK530_23060 [Tsukamurella conjunctivitidis]|uniref:Uncharacterized protein n=1 Tax=Tsukamurella conjunctivitidis TaxID=2592068 RepID=A0A5C5RSL1_9ACTN|nr:hypothetical protein [Tsukamurella conjunctivitidis]TWS25602.1 hypothetical protein FK530_23060 [Tsukamurella conjunctivitidis]
MTDPIAALLATCPTNNLIREVTIHADHDTVTVTHVYDRTEYEQYAQTVKAKKEQERRDLADLTDRLRKGKP